MFNQVPPIETQKVCFHSLLLQSPHKEPRLPSALLGSRPGGLRDGPLQAMQGILGTSQAPGLRGRGAGHAALGAGIPGMQSQLPGRAPPVPVCKPPPSPPAWA